MSLPLLRYILCTNILVYYCRGGDLADYIEAMYQLSSTPQVPLVSIVTEGELHAFARNNNWGTAKISKLNRLLNDFVRVNLDFPGVIEAYAEIDHFSQHTPGLSPRNMGKNDLWVAATAKATGACLLTTDHDFDHLDGHMITRHYIEPSSKIIEGAEAK